MSAEPSPTRCDAAIAGHTGDAATARRALDSPDPAVRATGLGALDRLDDLGDHELSAALTDRSAAVRRRAAAIAARHPDVDLRALLRDGDASVVETAAWTAGEHESDSTAAVSYTHLTLPTIYSV